MRLLVIASIVAATSCAPRVSGPASAPLAVWTSSDNYAWLEPGTCGDNPGVWVVNRAAAERIVRLEVDASLECKLSTLHESHRAELAEAHSKQLGDEVKKQNWWSSYGFPLGVASGGILAALVSMAVAALVK